MLFVSFGSGAAGIADPVLGHAVRMEGHGQAEGGVGWALCCDQSNTLDTIAIQFMLRVSLREIQNAARNHYAACGNAGTASSALLLVYAVECGIKALLMRSQNLNSTEQLPAELQIKHDLLLGLSLLRAPHELVNPTCLPTQSLHARAPQDRIGNSEIHQALRYGVPMAHDTDVVEHMKAIMAWIQEQSR
jgi:hypothetical protein